jgi:CheY-like chemotaxis protein
MTPRSVRIADDWLKFESGVYEEAPDLAIICMDMLVEGGPQAAVRAREFLAGEGVPVIIAIDEQDSEGRRVAEFVARFNHMIGLPVDFEDMARAVRSAIEADDRSEPGSADSEPGQGLSDIESHSDSAPGLPERSSEITDEYDAVDDTGVPGAGFFSLPPRASAASLPPNATTYASTLPALKLGSFGGAHPLRVLFAHHVAQSTGILRLKSGALIREIAYRNGDPGILGVRLIDPGKREKILSSLLWEDGSYQFDERQIPTMEFCKFGDVLELIFSAIVQGMGLNQLAPPLTRVLKNYPAVTDRVADNQALFDRLPGVRDFLDACGSETLETLVGVRPSEMQLTLQSAFFCRTVDAVAFMREPALGMVVIRHEFRGQSAAWARVKRVDTSATIDSQKHEGRLMEDLAERAAMYQRQEPYDIFGLRPGCGREAVQTVYYEMVKAHHPDTYALARSPDIKPLAEMVFRLVREAQSKLVKLEPGSPKKAAKLKPLPVEKVVPATTSHEFLDDAEAGSSAGRRRARRPRRRRRFGGRDGGSVGAHASQGTKGGRFSKSKAGSDFRRRPISGVKAVIQDDPGSRYSPEEHYKNGLVLLKGGSPGEAVAAFRMASEGDPGNGTYAANHAWSMYLDDPNTAEAVKIMLQEMSLSDTGDLELIALYLGCILRAEGDEKTASKLFERCLSYNPGNTEAQRQLRLYDMRQAKRGESIIDKLFTKRLKKGRKKKLKF